MVSLSVSENWNKIFEKYDILNEIQKHKVFTITADQIKEFKEPRLMTKFDFSNLRPKIFKDNNLGILPISNGMYTIGEFSLYCKLPTIIEEAKVITIPSYLRTIDPENVYSESNALHLVLLSGMLEQAFNGKKYVQTISGRMRPDGFDFNVISSTPNQLTHFIQVKKPQIEIDGGYESIDDVLIVEAKNSQPEDFIVRQLYYPYRYWKNKVGKRIIPIFLTYDNGTFNLYIYNFRNDNEYNSLELVRTENYIVQYEDTSHKKREIFQKITIEDEPSNIPFPQADSMNRVIETAFLINDGLRRPVEIANYFGITPRQGNYYVSACRYLDLVHQKNGEYHLSKIGELAVNSQGSRMNELIFSQVMKHRVFNIIYENYLRIDQMPSRNDVLKVMNDNLHGLDRVLVRRSSTVIAWINWLNGSLI